MIISINSEAQNLMNRNRIWRKQTQNQSNVLRRRAMLINPENCYLKVTSSANKQPFNQLGIEMKSHYQ